MSELKHGERLKMRNWLEQVINNREFPGVEWTDKRRCKFRVPWKHASRHGWDIEKDASIFKMWAVYTGKFPENCRELTQKESRKLAKVWKANFRCALNALQDVEVVREEGKSKGTDAFKVFQILPRKVKSRTVRLNSQGSEENSLTIKIRKRSTTTTTKRCSKSQKKQKERDVKEEKMVYPCFEHNYSEAMPSFNMTNGVEDVYQQMKEYTPSNDINYMMQNITMFNAGDTGVSYYGNESQYCSSEDLDTSSSGSDVEYGSDLVAQLLASPSYNVSSLNITQTAEGVTCTGQQIQQVMNSGYANEYRVANIPTGSPQQPHLHGNLHFKEGAVDPFCGSFDAKELSLAMQFRV